MERDQHEGETRPRNVAAKWIRLGHGLYTIVATDHESTPGILIRPVILKDDDDDSYMNVIVLDDTTDVLITFESVEAAKALSNAVMRATEPLPQAPLEDFHFSGVIDSGASEIIRAIEKLHIASRLAGTLSIDPGTRLHADEQAKEAENDAVQTVLRVFGNLPKRKG